MFAEGQEHKLELTFRNEGGKLAGTLVMEEDTTCRMSSCRATNSPSRSPRAAAMI